MTKTTNAMPAGAELDAMVATQVMGWPSGIINDRCLVCPTEKTFHRGDAHPWAPSANIEHAWEVLGVFDSYEVTRTPRGVRGKLEHWATMTNYKTGRFGTARGDTAAHAICRAALLTVRTNAESTP